MSKASEDLAWHRLTVQYRCKQRRCMIPKPEVIERRASVLMAACLGQIEYTVKRGYAGWSIGSTKVTTEVAWLVSNGDLRVAAQGTKVVVYHWEPTR